MKFKSLISLLLLSVGFTASADFMKFDAGRKLQYTKQIIENYYVDSVDMDSIVEQGIIAMLKELDPHSLYSTASETKELTESLDGNFSGIGVQYQMVQDTVYVIQSVAGGPSERVGIIPGDRIVAANDTVIAGVKMSDSKIKKHLRGPKGSIVNLKVVRRFEPDTLVFRVKRDDIPVYTIDASYMADPTTGYIRITSFGMETAKEFKKALAELQEKGMQNLIIDLQDNGGGYMSPAVEMSEMFLPFASTIVYTAGLHQETNYYTAGLTDADVSSRIVVLVNEYSASASEIFSGAMQDNDRGVIVGRRTFGKGLVQRPFPFPDGSMIRLTTAHYYTPSGRSIQKPYTRGQVDEYQNDLKNRFEHGEFYSADSIKLNKDDAYTTVGDRIVYGGGGIMPDCFVAADTTGINKYFRELRAKNVLNQYVVNYVEENRAKLTAKYKDEDAFLANFDVTDEMLAEFVALGESLGVAPDSVQLEECKIFIVGNVKGLIGRDLFTPTTYYRVMNPLSPIYKRGLQIINDEKRYNSLLGI